jgi:dipeptidyl aminopeptidase/acylaminoacyl peptidase
VTFLGLLGTWWGFYSSNLIIKAPRSPQEMTPGVLGLPYESASFLSEDGVKLAGWFVPSPGSGKTIIVCHGWSAERSNTLPSTAFLHQGGYNLLYFDFRNHGESGGNRSSLGPWEGRDLMAAVRTLLQNKQGSARWIGAWGLSMGAAVALTTAADHPEIRAVVAESSYSSSSEAIVRSAKIFYGISRSPLTRITLLFVRWRLGVDPEPFSPRYHMGRISPRPLLLIQGDRDARAPVSEGRILLSAAGEPKELWTVPGADHGEAHSKDPATYERKVLEFFNKASKGSS